MIVCCGFNFRCSCAFALLFSRLELLGQDFRGRHQRYLDAGIHCLRCSERRHDGLAAAHEHFLALQDLQEVDRVDVLAGVVLGNVVVHVWAVRVVPDDAGGRVPVVAGNIILPVVKYT